MKSDTPANDREPFRAGRLALGKIEAEGPNDQAKNTICLWFDKDAHEAARFYAATFPDSKVTAVHKAPGDYPSGKAGDVVLKRRSVPLV